MSKKKKTNIEKDEFDRLVYNLILLNHARSETYSMIEAEIANANFQFAAMLRSFGFKPSGFYNKAVCEYADVGFASEAFKNVMKHIYSTYICPKTIKGSKEYASQLECINFKGTCCLDRQYVSCDVSAVKFVIEDKKTGKCFSLEIPVSDNWNTQNLDVLQYKKRGAICLSSTTSAVNVTVPVESAFYDDNLRPKVFFTTYSAKECAQAIKDYLTTDKYDSVDLMFEEIKRSCRSMIESTSTCFRYDDYSAYSRNHEKSYYYDYDYDNEKADSIQQLQIDQFIKHYRKYCIESLAYQCAQTELKMKSSSQKQNKLTEFAIKEYHGVQ